jgi:RHS repeat-associated protein
MSTEHLASRITGGAVALIVATASWLVVGGPAAAQALPMYEVEASDLTPDPVETSPSAEPTLAPPVTPIAGGATAPTEAVEDAGEQPANPEGETLDRLETQRIVSDVAVVPVGADVVGGVVVSVHESSPQDAIAAHLGTTPPMGAARPDLVQLEADVVADGEELRVETIAPEDSTGLLAFALRLELVDPLAKAGYVDVTLDWDLLSQNYGADYGSRLRLVALPECYLTTPDERACATPIELGYELDENGFARATLPVEPAVATPLPDGAHGMARSVGGYRGLKMWTSGGGTIIAAVSGGSGAAGTFAATDLAPQGTWNVGQQTGTFTYSIPLDAPPVEAGRVPDLTLRYSSAAIDGRSPAANGQASWVGDGWDLSFGYIERLYANCQLDLPDYPTVVGDNCWRSPFNATGLVDGQTVSLGSVRDRAGYVMSLGGQTFELVPIGDGNFRTSVESGIRIKRLEWQTPSNTQAQGEYFKVQLPDGSVAYFGLGANGNSARPFTTNTNSVLVMPIVGDDAGEPCNGVAFCDVAYRWMLDFEHDASFNATVYTYEKLTNSTYPRGVAPLRSYDMAALPSSIKYGSKWTGDFASALQQAQAKIEFSTVNRCTTLAVPNPEALGTSPTCGGPSTATKALYPDVPVDLLCSTSCSTVTHRTPAFFTTKRLNSVTTSVRIDGSFVPVATHKIAGTYPLPPESSGNTLWLDALYTTYFGGDGTEDDVTTYATTFDGEKYPNRVDWTLTTEKLEKRRLTSIRNAFGGVVSVNYVTEWDGSATNRHCMTDGTTQLDFASHKSAIVSTPWNNTWDCYGVPLTHTRLGSPTTTWGVYHKYLVDDVVLSDPVANTTEQVFDYTYEGNPAWAYHNDILYVPGVPVSSRGGIESWTSYRGYEIVSITTGSGAAVSTTRTQFFRGLNGTYRGPDPVWSSSVAAFGGSLTRTDEPILQGMVAASETKRADGEVMTRVRNEYVTREIVAPTYLHGAWFIEHVRVDNWERQLDGSGSPISWLKARTTTTYDSSAPATERLRQPIQQVVDGDTSVTGDETCSTLEYAWSVKNASGSPAATFGDPASWGGKNYILVPTSGETWWGACDTGIKTGAWQTFYDESTPGSLSNANLWRGLPTTERTLVEEGVWLESRATYGVRGRITSAQTPSDLANDPPTATTWEYDDEVDYEAVTVTNAKDQSTTTWYDRTFGNPVKSVDANGLFTHYKYDAAGRLLAGWAPVQSPTPLSATRPADSVLPTVSFIYDASAPGLAVRNRPVAIAQAQFAGFDGSTPVVHEGVGTARRSYTFYDGWGRVVQQHSVAPDGSGGRLVTATGYTDTGAVAWVTEPFADEDPAQFASGLVDVATADVERHTATTYDWAGRPLAQEVLPGVPGTTASAIASTQYEYAGLVSRVTAASGAVTETESDALGRMIRQTQVSELGSTDGSLTTLYSYRVQGSTLEEDEPGFSEVIVTDPEENETVFVSDLAGRKRTLVDPNSGTSVYEYDDGGRVTSIESATGTLSMEYDVLGRMTWRGVLTGENEHDASKSSASWTYDPAGHVGAVDVETAWTATPVGVFQVEREFSYDALQRVTSTETRFPGSPLLGELSDARYTTSVTYDALGQVQSTSSVAQRQVVPGTLTPLWPLADQTFTTGLDVLGRADALTVTTGSTAMHLVTGVSFSPTGQLLSRNYGNGVAREYTWDEDWGAVESVSASFDAGAQVLQSDVYDRDGAGRVISVADGVSDVAQCYSYDGFNRLAWAWADTRASSTCDGDWSAATQPSGAQESLGFALNYDYSASGRINTVRDALMDPDLGDGVEPGAVATYDYDPEVLPHAVTSVDDGETEDLFTYDAAGRMITRTVDDGNAVTNDLMTLTWDESSNLVATGSATGNRVYVYDASGQRVAQIAVSELTSSATPVSATIYVGDAEGTDADTATTDPDDVSATRFITFGGATVATVTVTTTATSWSLLFGDVQGSAQVSMPLVPDALETTGLEPASTAHTPMYDAYLPYGAERGDTDLTIDRGWLGQYEDSGTGLTYLNARYYDPVLGRFLSPDPLMDPGDPRTLDPYMYAANNPVTFMDATGLCYGLDAKQMAACAQSLNTSAAALAKAKTRAQGVVGVTGMLAGGLLKGVGKGVLGLTPFPGMIDGFQKTGDFIRDPRGTWNGQWNGLGTQWSNTWHDVKRTGEAFSDAVGGRNTWNNYWHVGTHTWMAGHIGENYDNGTWFNIAEGAGDAGVYIGVAAVTLGAGSAVTGTRLAANTRLSRVPEPQPQFLPNGTPNRGPAAWVNTMDEGGNVATHASSPGVHAEVAAQAAVPGAPMSSVWGWRGPTSSPVWQRIPICSSCQAQIPPSLFPPGVTFDNGPWGSS